MSPESRETIVVPEDIKKSLALEAKHAAEASRVASLEAARNIIEGVPVAETGSPKATSEPAEVVKQGKFGHGVIETTMPADPSHVIGWDGIVRR